MYIKELNEKLKKRIEETFIGVKISNSSAQTSEHETLVTGIRLTSKFMNDKDCLCSDLVINMLIEEIEVCLNNKEYTMEEFISLKAIDRLGNGVYYNIGLIGKFRK